MGQFHSRSKVPILLAMSNSECGVACLRMILASFGRWVDLQSLREECGVSRDGTNARVLLRVARKHGLRTTYATQLDPRDLRGCRVPAILHWDFNHFVVLERVDGKGVTIVDPNAGRARWAFAELASHFTGVALFFEPSEVFETQKRSRATLETYFLLLSPHRGLVASLFLLTILGQLVTIATARVTQVVIDDVIPSSDFALLHALLVGLMLVAFLQASMVFIRWRLLTYFRTALDLEMTLGFFSHLVLLPYAFFQQRSSGDLVMRLSSTFQIRDLLSDRLLSVVLDAAMLVILAVALIVVSPFLGLTVIALGMTRVGVLVCIRRQQRELMRRGLHAQAKAQSSAVEIVHGIHAIKAGGNERRWFEQWRSLFVEQLNLSIDLSRIGAVADSILLAVGIGSPAIVLFLGAREVLLDQMSVGDMVAFAALAAAFASPLLSLSSAWSSWQMAGQHLDRISEVLEHRPEQIEAERQSVVLAGAVAMQDVSFSYSSGSKPILNRISLSIPAGSYVAIVGQSGSGKSTLAKLLLGLHVPTEGCVMYDGIDMQKVELGGLRRQIGSVVQDAKLMSGTIRDFITNGDTTPDQELFEAARAACFHDEIIAMPLGYDTIIAENGANFSSGQQQRLAIARAVLSRPAILLFDEATSAVDSITESKIHDNLADLSYTRIVISHRFATIRNVSRAYVLDKGSIVEEGRPADLLRENGRFSQMFDLGASWAADA